MSLPYDVMEQMKESQTIKTNPSYGEKDNSMDAHLLHTKNIKLIFHCSWN